MDPKPVLSVRTKRVVAAAAIGAIAGADDDAIVAVAAAYSVLPPTPPIRDVDAGAADQRDRCRRRPGCDRCRRRH
mgnify:CR=1 FL=1